MYHLATCVKDIQPFWDSPYCHMIYGFDSKSQDILLGHKGVPICYFVTIQSNFWSKRIPRIFISTLQIVELYDPVECIMA